MGRKHRKRNGLAEDRERLLRALRDCEEGRLGGLDIEERDIVAVSIKRRIAELDAKLGQVA